MKKYYEICTIVIEEDEPLFDGKNWKLNFVEKQKRIFRKVNGPYAKSENDLWVKEVEFNDKFVVDVVHMRCKIDNYFTRFEFEKRNKFIAEKIEVLGGDSITRREFVKWVLTAPNN